MQVTNVPTVPGSSAQTSVASNSDFQMFLTMLTTQLKNQDPLNPVDSADYAMQLATFSNVEQSVKTNTILEEMKTLLGLSGLGEVADWVGKEALSSAPMFLHGQEVSLIPYYMSGASSAQLVVSNEAGQVVWRDELGVGLEQFNWSSANVPDGKYTFSVNSYSGETLLGSTPVSHYTPVAEVRHGGKGATVILADGTALPASEVTGLR